MILIQAYKCFENHNILNEQQALIVTVTETLKKMTNTIYYVLSLDIEKSRSDMNCSLTYLKYN